MADLKVGYYTKAGGRPHPEASPTEELQGGIDENQVIPDDGDAEDEGVDTIEDAAVAGE